MHQITVRTCKCGLQWTGGNSKYCELGHAYEFTISKYVPIREVFKLQEQLAYKDHRWDEMRHERDFYKRALERIEFSNSREEMIDIANDALSYKRELPQPEGESPMKEQ